MLGFIVRNALGPIKLGQSGFDFRQKYQPFYGIVDRGIWRHRLKSFDNTVAGQWFLHDLIVKHILRQAELHVAANTHWNQNRAEIRHAEERCLAAPLGPTSPTFFAGIQLKRSIDEEQLLAVLFIDV